MKKLIIVLSSCILVACVSQAIEPTNQAAVSVSVAEIRDNASVLANRQFVSTGQPDEEVLSVAKDAGFVAVVDLRGESEDRGFDEPAVAKTLGLRYVALPIAASADVTFDNAERLDSILAGIDGPVLLHCASGNRVGALFALRASLAGASDEDALATGKAAGLTGLEAVVKQRLEEKQ